MSDLIERLRSTRRWDINAISPVYADLACEAAAELAALRARVAELEGAMRDVIGYLDGADTKNRPPYTIGIRNIIASVYSVPSAGGGHGAG